MTYQQTLDYLFAQLPMYQRIGQAAYKADLENTEWLMDVLNHPEKSLRCVHIAGTNGKGSTSHLLASIFQEAGYNVGLYTSPHLVDFRERVKVNGRMISEEKVIDFTERYKNQFHSKGLSFFEWTVGLAFDHFRSENVDLAIIEVGMGGRLDSTNVVQPDLSIITNIGLDHTQFLGDTLQKIAGEKGGIIKQNTPVLIGRTQRETKNVFETIAKNKLSEIIFGDEQFSEKFPPCPLKGNYQKENFNTVLKAIKILHKKGWKISSNNLSQGFQNILTNTNLKGRWDIIQKRPLIICDVGHNADGLKQNIEQLKSLPHQKLHFLLGFVNDKNLNEIVTLFPKNATYHLTKASVPRALEVEILKSLFINQVEEINIYSSVEEAMNKILSTIHSEDLLYVGGSTFIVADFYKSLS